MRLLLYPALLVLLGCAGIQRVPLRNEVVRLSDGRFIGPLEIPVPRRADHQGHDFELQVTLRARCAPRLVLAFPDGETQSLGEDDSRWQELLSLRAAGEKVSAPPQAAPLPPVQEEPLPYPGPTSTGASVVVDATVVIPLPPRPAGHWESVTTETWSGQLAFERARVERCARVGEYRVTYLNAFDETGMLTLWAEVPQELLEGSLSYEIIELVPPKVEQRSLVVTTTPPAPTPPPKIRPPAPSPRTERPAPAGDARATWIPGQWAWHEGEGEWVWHPGS